MADGEYAEYMDIEHTGPGTLAGRYLRTFWHPVYRAEDLAPGRAVPITIMSEQFTLYRGEDGAPHLLDFRCAHRGTQLSTGWVEGDCIRCFYHGWKYDASGQCVEQPAEDAGFAGKVRIRSYPVRDYLGLMFAYLGPAERGDTGAFRPPPFRRYPDFEQPGVLIAIRPESWPCNYFNRLDNDPDAMHVLFTHRESIARVGRAHQYLTRRLSAEVTEYGVRTTMSVPGRPDEYLHSHMPNVNQLRVKTGVASARSDAEPIYEDRITWAVPIDDENSHRFELNLVHLTGPEGEAYRERFRQIQAATRPPNEIGDAILAGKLRISDLDPPFSTYELFRVEDYVAQVGQGRIVDRANDRLGRIDSGVVLRRKLWQRELKALADGRPLHAWVIPEGLADMCPAVLA